MNDHLVLVNQHSKERCSPVALNLLDDMIEEGVILDKTKFRIVFEDETPTSVRIKIEPVYDLTAEQKVVSGFVLTDQG